MTRSTRNSTWCHFIPKALENKPLDRTWRMAANSLCASTSTLGRSGISVTDVSVINNRPIFLCLAHLSWKYGKRDCRVTWAQEANLTARGGKITLGRLDGSLKISRKMKTCKLRRESISPAIFLCLENRHCCQFASQNWQYANKISRYNLHKDKMQYTIQRPEISPRSTLQRTPDRCDFSPVQTQTYTAMVRLRLSDAASSAVTRPGNEVFHWTKYPHHGTLCYQSPQNLHKIKPQKCP